MLLYIRGTSNRLVSGLQGAPYVPKTYYMYVLNNSYMGAVNNTTSISNDVYRG